MAREGVFFGQLEAFLEVARLENMTRAAEALFLTQPALTARLKRLEQELGISLLVRDRRGTRLTEEGRAFLPFAEEAIHALESGQQAIASRAETPAELSVGATPTLSAYILPAIVKRLLDANPRMRLTIRTAVSEELLGLVVSGEVQLGLGRALHHSDVDATPLYEEEFVVVAHSAHPAASRRPMRVADFADEVLILFNRSPSYHDFLRSLLHRAGVSPRCVVDVDNSEASKRMARERIGITLLPRTAVAAELRDGSLSEIRVVDMDPIRRPMAALRLRNAPESPLAPVLLRLLRSRIGQMGLRYRRTRRAQTQP